MISAVAASEVGEMASDIWGQQSRGDINALDSVDTDALIAVLSHDVSNLASALAGVFEMIITGQLSPASEEYAEFVSMGYHCSRDLLDAINLIVNVHRMRTGKRTLAVSRFRVDDLASFAMDRVRERARDRIINLTQETPQGNIAMGDVVLLRGAMIALLAHAIRMTPKEGTVTLQANQESESDVPFLLVRVADQADPLFRDGTKHPLSSLLPGGVREQSAPRNGITLDEVGLAFCEAVTMLHGGQAWVASHEAAGNVFTFSIPMPDLKFEEYPGTC